ncbi:hypothetical protein SAMN05421761_1306 [Belliella pelovolcani]|uniref:Uncharacterized protein n=1 Tax=Belliella pelovolcani TaxID=529505 RepID=A0A1N7Q4L9_9BACT|nr:hypothetical protein SAMN05421761_1306 [Belliella pelovolcani]
MTNTDRHPELKKLLNVLPIKKSSYLISIILIYLLLIFYLFFYVLSDKISINTWLFNIK